MSQSRISPDAFEFGLAGTAFNTGAGPLAVPNGSAFRLLMTNPLGSGKLMMVQRARYYTTKPNDFATVRLNATTNLPVTARTSLSQRVGKPNGVVVVTADVFAGTMSGGATLAYQLPMIQDTLSEFNIFPTRAIPAGNSISLESVNGSGGAATVVMLVDWYEVPFVT